MREGIEFHAMTIREGIETLYNRTGAPFVEVYYSHFPRGCYSMLRQLKTKIINPSSPFPWDDFIWIDVVFFYYNNITTAEGDASSTAGADCSDSAGGPLTCYACYHEKEDGSAGGAEVGKQGCPPVPELQVLECLFRHSTRKFL